MKPQWTYEVLDLGRTEVTEHPGGRVSVLELHGAARAQFRVAHFERWFPLIAMECRRIGIFEGWGAGFVFAENEPGDPGTGEIGGGAGVGLGQLTSFEAKGSGRYTDAQLRDPALNLRLTFDHVARGIVYLRTSKRLCPCFTCAGRQSAPVDLVHLVATYNAGSPRINPGSVWGLHTHKAAERAPDREHISRAVAASNTAIALLTSATDPAMPAPDIGRITAEQHQNLLSASRSDIGFASGIDDDTPTDPDDNA